MTEIVLCNTQLKADALPSLCGVETDTLTGIGQTSPNLLDSHTPYLVGENPGPVDRSILGCLSPAPVSRELTHLALTYGEDNTLALAEISAKLQDYNIGLMGASTSIYANRIHGFGKAVREYQDALMDYRRVMKARGGMKILARQKVERAYQKLQIRFRHELAAVTAQVKARRGTPLTSTTRGMNIARSSRNAVKLDVTSQIQAHNLVRFSKHAKVLGNGLAVIDFGSRVGNIHNSYKAGDNWERELFIESTSFAASALAATAVVNIGGVTLSTLSLLLVATPFGWAGLVVGGLVVAGIAAGTGMGMNYIIKENSGDWYDAILSWIEK